MLTFEITLNPLVLMAISLFSAWIGFSIKKRRIAKDRIRINQYEKEMVLNHAEILELQKDYITLEIRMRELTTPVIPMSGTIHKDSDTLEAEKTAIDTALRKKLLSVEKSVEKSSKAW